VQYFVCIFLEQTETQVGESQVCTASRLGNNSGSFSCETQFRVGMFTYLNIASIKTKEFFVRFAVKDKLTNIFITTCRL